MKIWKNLFGNGDKIHADEIAVTPDLLLGGAVIVESGNTPDGLYYKFGNGLMIVHATFTETITTSGTIPRFVCLQRNFPRGFLDTPSINTSAPLAEIMGYGYRILTGAQYQPVVYSDRVLTDKSVNFSVFAIGRYK